MADINTPLRRLLRFARPSAIGHCRYTLKPLSFRAATLLISCPHHFTLLLFIRIAITIFAEYASHIGFAEYTRISHCRQRLHNTGQYVMPHTPYMPYATRIGCHYWLLAIR